MATLVASSSSEVAAGGQHQWGEHVVGPLEGERPVDPELLQAPRVSTGVLQPTECGVEPHRVIVPRRSERRPRRLG